MDTSEFVIGQRWVSHSDTALGLGIVTDLSGRRVTLGFPAADEERTYAIDNAPLSRIMYQIGEEIETFDGERFTVRAVEDLGGVLMYYADDGSDDLARISEVKLSSAVDFSAPHQRLFAGQFDRNGAFRLRMATAGHQDRLRASAAQGLIGARTQHLPHQIYIAHEVATRFAPRVLLADEVGLGKTIEAGLILHYQLHTQRARRALVVVPDSLIHQWLVEMLRRFNLRFSIIDQGRYEAESAFAEFPEDDEDVIDDAAANPFEAEQLALCSLDFLMSNEQAQQDAQDAGWDLMVVDEAHHLAWSPEAPSPEYRLIEQLSAASNGLLLLTATPEQVGIASHFARLRLLDPARFHDLEAFRKEEEQYEAINNAVTRLREQGADLDKAAQSSLQGWLGDDLDRLMSESDPVQAITDALLDRHGTGRVLFRNTRAAIEGFPERKPVAVPLPCPALYEPDARHGRDALSPEFGVDEERWLAEDPRVAWLEQTLTRLKPAKVVVICAHASTAVALEHYLQLRAGIRSTAFHEHLSLVERDRAAAYFADDEQGAHALICSEIGSEGRNFQFAHHLVLFDLPANPDLLEQRIGRLDRIGQTDTIDIHIPYLEGTAQASQFRWFDEGLNAFAESCSVGVAVQNAVAGQWQQVIDGGDAAGLESLISASRAEADRLRELLRNGRDALIELNSCRPDVASTLIAAIELEEAGDPVREYMLDACDILGVDIEDHSEHADILRPGEQYQAGHVTELPEDGLTVTWNRQQALEREDMAFMSWEHPLVSGIMESVTSSGLGKAALATMSVKALPAGTLLLEALYTVHCPAPESLQLSRFLPVSPVRLLVDVNGRDLSATLPHDRLNDMCSNIRRRTAQSIVPQIRPQVETMVDHAERLAEPHLEPLKAAALEGLRQHLEPEIQRLESMKQVNPAIREEEITFFREQLAAARSAIGQASLSLEGIRVIVTA
ncbi:RNA polymerase-associated protein RapA [Marinobacter confluentis]|uniref:RNA polymerase-associated protein RapA n=1 Tax=Marinobacter confluentis TaxID=1697557 RepID=A0A4Z1BZ65_9GAMM|nr:RNA polymerase-associated protein RapA [Marinobacter confluentis]TGN38783.1 RNA polymerase-associated protein RapA [Marinobacter confluentis]